MLSNIINDVNKNFWTTFSDEDRVILNNLSKRLLWNDALIGAITNNSSEDVIRVKFDELFTQELVSMFRSNFDLFHKIDQNVELKEYVNKKMFDFISDQVNKNR